MVGRSHLDRPGRLRLPHCAVLFLAYQMSFVVISESARRVHIRPLRLAQMRVFSEVLPPDEPRIPMRAAPRVSAQAATRNPTRTAMRARYPTRSPPGAPALTSARDPTWSSARTPVRPAMRASVLTPTPSMTTTTQIPTVITTLTTTATTPATNPATTTASATDPTNIPADAPIDIMAPPNPMNLSTGDDNLNFGDEHNSMPKSQIAIVTVCIGRAKPDDNSLIPFTALAQYMPASLANKYRYARIHGYDFHPVFSSVDPVMSSAWQKIAIISDLLKRYEWVWGLDADTFITNKNYRIEEHVVAKLRNKDASLIVNMDCNGLNSGSFFIRDTPWSHRFLQRVWNARRNLRTRMGIGVNEQPSMVYFLAHAPPAELRAHVEFMPSSVFNAYPAALRCGVPWAPGDFVMHFPGDNDKVADMSKQFKRSDLAIRDMLP